MSDIKQKLVDIIANICFQAGKGLNSNELNEIADQTDKAIYLAIAERDKEIVEMISDEWCKSGKDSNKRAYLDDVINIITK